MAAGEQQTIDMGASMETVEALDIIDALNEVSDVTSMAGQQVTFIGTQVASLDALPGQPNLEGVDVYSCPRGWFILFRTTAGPNWCVAGSSASEAAALIEDDALREPVLHALERRGLL
jgi:hypothetical protein